MSPVERLSTQDIGAFGVLDGAGPDGCPRNEQVRAAIGSRALSVPRFRQVVVVPRRGLGRPLWVDAERVDLEHHVRVVDAGGDLLGTVERLRRRGTARREPDRRNVRAAAGRGGQPGPPAAAWTPGTSPPPRSRCYVDSERCNPYLRFRAINPDGSVSR